MNPNEILSPEAQKIYDYFYDAYSRGESDHPFDLMEMARQTGLSYQDILDYMLELHRGHFLIYHGDLSHMYSFYPNGDGQI